MTSRGVVVSLLAGAFIFSPLSAGEPARQGKPDGPQKVSRPGETEPEQVLVHCRKLLDAMTAVHDSTKSLHKRIEDTADKKPRPEELKAARELAGNVEASARVATKAIELLEADGSAVAILEVLRGVCEDVNRVQGRLAAGDVGPATQAIEQDVIDTLREMVEALEKG
jgi:hypothetical protein